METGTPDEADHGAACDCPEILQVIIVGKNVMSTSLSISLPVQSGASFHATLLDMGTEKLFSLFFPVTGSSRDSEPFLCIIHSGPSRGATSLRILGKHHKHHLGGFEHCFHCHFYLVVSRFDESGRPRCELCQRWGRETLRDPDLQYCFC